MKFSGVITLEKSDVHAKGQGQKSKVKVMEVKTQFSRFRTVTPVWIYIWWWNYAQRLMLLRRGALLFFKVICQISRSHRTKKSPILIRIERFRTVSPAWIHWWLWNNAQSLKQQKEVSYSFSRSSVKSQGHTGQKIADFDPNWVFPDCNSSLIAPMDLKWCTKLDVLFKRCPIVFQGHPSNFKATQAEKSMTWIQFE